ncbi:MAG TPA: hypothetical protein VN081_00960, partial [Dongiaceae bacterium]|nr:hypothetical protein [Dongiaceae bacterium]
RFAAYHKGMVKENYTDMLLEDINGKFDFLIELVTPLTLLPAAVAQLQEDVTQMRKDLGVTNRVVKDHSKALHNHAYRIKRLESA